jgi:hypothetical protein
MISQVIRNEEELRALIRKELKKAGSQCAPTSKELDEQVENFMNDEDLVPDEYPIYMFIDFTFQYHGLSVDCLTTSHTLTKSQMRDFMTKF